MFAVPPVTPVTRPEELPTVALVALLLVHVPPVVPVLLRVVVVPWHNANVPLMADGSAFTVAVAVRTQPAELVRVMVAVPAATPVITPDVLPIVAIPASLLLHAPPDVPALARLEVAAAQTVSEPEITPGSGLIVIFFVLRHPVGNV